MSARRWMILPVLLILLNGSACDLITGPEEISADAVATNSCGPLDGPAVEIFLSTRPVTSLETTLPRISVNIWRRPRELTERRWRLTDGEDGSALYYRNDSEPEFATSGEVTVRNVAADTTIEGSVDVEFGDAGHFRGDFRAIWIRNNALCG